MARKRLKKWSNQGSTVKNAHLLGRAFLIEKDGFFTIFKTWKFALKLLYSPWEITSIFTFIFDKCSKIPGNVQNETLFSGQKVGDCSQCQYKMFLDVRHGGRLKFCFFNDRATKKAEMILYCITFKYLVDLQHIARKTLSNILSQISHRVLKQALAESWIGIEKIGIEFLKNVVHVFYFLSRRIIVG